MPDNQDSVQIEAKASSQEEDLVPKKAYTEVAADMHKYKTEVREAKAQLVKEKEEKEALIREKLEEQKRYQELYEKERDEKSKALEQIKVERKNFLDSHKVNYLIQELGGLAKPEYIKHANLNAIEINDDGQVDQNSLKKEADRFRQEHAVLLKNFKLPTLPNEAPKEKQTPNAPMKGFETHQQALKNAMLGK
jgi:hypothetical protein